MTSEDRVTRFANQIIDQMKDPYEMNAFWIFNAHGLENNLKEWKDYMSTVKLHYAVKCNPAPVLVKPLVDAGYSFDCASVDEMHEVIALGCTPDRIVYSQSFKPISHLLKAHELGIRLTIVDSFDEIKKVAKYAPEMNVLLRLNHNDASAGYSLGDRFGVDPDEIEPMIKAIKEAKLNMVGTHFHVGSEAHSIEAFQTGIKLVRSTFDVAERYGFHPTVVDLGGGFSHVADLSKFGPAIQQSFIDNKFPEGTYMMAEPGRFVASYSFGLALQIHGKKIRKLPNGVIEYDYTVADGLHGSLAYCDFFKKELPAEILRVYHPLGEEKHHSAIYGPTCDSRDKVDTIDFPELEIGDWIFFRHCGAYTMSMASNFNGFEARNHKIFELTGDIIKTPIQLPDFIEKYGIPSLDGLPNKW